MYILCHWRWIGLISQGKHFDEINSDDIKELVEECVFENRYLEYKRTLPGKLEEGKRHLKFSNPQKEEFLADVSSFANSYGGYLIFGVGQNKNQLSLNPIRCSDTDAIIRQLEQVIMRGLDPRVNGIQIREILMDSSSSEYVLIMKIPESWQSPHIVWFGESGKFWRRVSGGKDQMDVKGIREAFLLTERRTTQIAKFREERVRMIMSGNAPVFLEPKPTLILHLTPLNAFDTRSGIDLKLAETHIQKLSLPEVSSFPLKLRYNLEGVLVSYLGFEMDDHGSEFYVQIFRDGCMEICYCGFLTEAEKPLYPRYWEKWIRQRVTMTLEFLQVLSVDVPISLMLSIIHVLGRKFHVSGHEHHPLNEMYGQYRINHDMLLLPDFLIESYDDDLDDVLIPLFDIMWQSAGWRTSPDRLSKK
ncbi:MAG: hypothetical protein GF411_13100 [Candidatus Lokiarchaeota archaeon]|nr:hypothetical protein [Candidatus Lokiarchaeota archaeon]